MDSIAESLETRYDFLVKSFKDDEKQDVLGCLARGWEALQREITPIRAVELALEFQLERERLIETTLARDAAVHRLLDAYVSVRRQSELIEQLQKEREEHGLEKLCNELPLPLDRSECALNSRIIELETMLQDLRDTNERLTEYVSVERKWMSDPPPHYDGEISVASVAVQTEASTNEKEATTHTVSPTFCAAHPKLCELMSSPTPDIIELVQARNNMLASIPLPENVPDMTLAPITLPAQVTVHEFLNAAPSSLRTQLGNYRVFHNTMTNWCPDREEHGFMYVPVFKCSTNPRALTAHRWSAVDVIGQCFFNNEGTWYYAGSYKAFYLDMVSTQEWDQLSSETTAALIKETLAGRKNTTPQNNYETGQLYASGALKIACIALQCVGFNLDVYHAVSELATKFILTKWKPSAIAASSNNSPSAGSTSSSISGTPPINSNSFSGISMSSPHGSASHHTPSHGLGHLTHGYGHGDTLLPHSQSKVNSPLSPHDGSGPCTPNLPNSVMSTPGVSPIGRSVATGGGNGGGLGTGSPAWNMASGHRLNSGTMGLNTMSTLGLQLSNIRLSPGARSGVLHQQRHAASMFYDGSANNQNVPPGPGVIGSGAGLMAGMAIGGGAPCYSPAVQHDVFGEIGKVKANAPN